MAPVIAISAIFLFVVSLMIVTWPDDGDLVKINVELVSSEPVEELVELPAEAEEPAEAINEPEIEITPVESDEIPVPELSELIAAPSVPNSIAIPSMVQPEAVSRITSPVTMQSVAGATRTVSARKRAIKRFGGNDEAETAVLRALRWIKSQQLPNGKWQAKGEGDATAFALLAFLSHGESLNSPEFGASVKSALNYLLEHHKNNMSVYALSESAAVIRTPVLTERVEAIIAEFCGRQRKKIKANGGGMLHRYSAVMAIRSAQLAKIRDPQLDEAADTYRQAFLEMRNAKLPDFAKIKGLGTWHYMIAGVCLQYLGHGQDPETVRMLHRLDELWVPATLGKTEIACCPVRSNYFSTMIFFNAGGQLWEKWNQGMLEAYTKTQTVEGELGYWRCQDQHIGDQPFWTTCYIAHQLMVYYRYLPTYSESAWNATIASPKLNPRNFPEVEIEIDL